VDEGGDFMHGSSEDYSRIEKAIHYLDRSFPERPSLAQVAANLNLSEFHFQRMFRRWAGISPKRFLQYLTLDYAKLALANSGNVLEAAYAAGLSSPGRLHDLFVSVEAVTPGEFKQKGAGLEIRYGLHPTPFGECLLAVTDRGICHLSFVPEGGRARAVRSLESKWANGRIANKLGATAPVARRIFSPGRNGHSGPLPLFLSGTNFQIKVWEALLKIPAGNLVAYDALAARVGKPGAARAIGHAVGQNPIAFVIPCHRVIRKIGVPGGYRWGAERKRAMIAWEAAHASGLSNRN
jgi:AraC family transcriptional regulator, regulatory protein of adaptative response / methylated-DNA-[protein]-cysteine methyltransferase